MRAAVGLWLLAAPAGAQPGALAGIVADPEGAPAAGALVTLHEARSRRLVAFTYTMDDGRFALEAPEAAGEYVAVATAGARAGRRAFRYRPGQPASLLEVPIGGDGDGRWTRVWDWMADKLDGFVGAVIGLVAGLVIRSFEEKRTAAKTLAVRRQAVRLKAETLAATLERLEGEERRPDARGILYQEGIERIWSHVGGDLQDLAAERDKLVAVEGLVLPALRGDSVRRYAELQQALREVEELRTSGGKDVERLGELKTALKRVVDRSALEA